MGGIPKTFIPHVPPGIPLPADLDRTHRQSGSIGTSHAADAIEHVDIAKGVSEVRVHFRDHGLPHEYVDALAEYAKEHDTAFFVRARNRAAHDFHASCYPVLPRGSRLSTAKKFGPLTGLVPADDIFLSPAAQLQASELKAAGAVATELYLSKARIDELAAQAALRKEPGHAPGTLRLTCSQKDKGQPYVFTAIEEPVGSGLYRISHDGKPVHVLGEDRGDRVLPYTDPIDLMAVSDDKRETSATHLDAMNAALGRANTPVLQAHDAGAHPDAGPADFFPCVVFGPPSMKIDGAAMAKNVNELSRLFKMAADAGCPLPVVSSWPSDIKTALQSTALNASPPPVRKDSALKARLLAQALSDRKS
jgi:hypothetical protein